jgi:putative hemolysin
LPDWRVLPLPSCRCYADDFVAEAGPGPALPRLMQMYLDHRVKIVSPPAMDRAFKTIDYLVILDLDTLDEPIRRMYVR